MKKIVRLTSLLLIGVMLVAFALSGCSTKKEEPKPAEKTQAEEHESTQKVIAEKGEPLEITILNNYKMPENAPVKKKIEEAFNIRLKALSNHATTAAEQMQILSMKIAAGEIPDVFTLGGYDNLRKYAEQNVIAEMPIEKIKNNAPRLWAYMEKIDPDGVVFTNVKGKNYGMPTVWPLGARSRTMAIRKDWLDKLRMKMPETLDELEDVLTAFRNNDPDGNGKKDTYGMSFYDVTDAVPRFMSIYGAFGAHPQIFQVKNGQLVYGSIIPEAKKALEVLNSWYKKELIDPSFFVDKYQVFSEKWASGKFGVIPDTWWWTASPASKYFSGALHDPVVQANPNAVIERLAPPKGPNGDQGMAQMSVHQVIPVIVFGKQAEKDYSKAERYMQVLDELQNTREWTVLIYYGDEGVTFKWNPDGTPQYIPPYDKRENLDEYGCNGYFSWFPNYDIYDVAIGRDVKWLEEQRAKAIGPVDALKSYPLEALIKFKPTLAPIEQKAYIGFITGQRPLSEFDNFVKEWLDSGGKEVLEEATRVYNERFRK